jgi:gliding motility-associated lipoprotein GldH
MKRALILIGLAVSVLMAGSCKNRNLYLHNVPIAREGWPEEKIMRFDVPVTDTTGAYTIFLQVRNDGRYESSNLWLFITTHSPTGAMIRDTVECRLADEQGRWLGKGSGGRYSLEIPFRYRVRFPNAGTYVIEVEHGMRADVLQYITDLGIRIEKAS